jgi:hypothetical protein
VVKRFTDLRDIPAVQKACNEILRVNGIEDARYIRPGTELLIPVDMLSAQYNPQGYDLGFVTKDGEQFATYRLKAEESLYKSVVERFTDLQDIPAILDACERIQEVNGIDQARAVKPGTRVLIPADMLSAQYRPEGGIVAQTDEEEAEVVPAVEEAGEEAEVAMAPPVEEADTVVASLDSPVDEPAPAADSADEQPEPAALEPIPLTPYRTSY